MSHFHHGLMVFGLMVFALTTVFRLITCTEVKEIKVSQKFDSTGDTFRTTPNPDIDTTTKSPSVGISPGNSSSLPADNTTEGPSHKPPHNLTWEILIAIGCLVTLCALIVAVVGCHKLLFSRPSTGQHDVKLEGDEENIEHHEMDVRDEKRNAEDGEEDTGQHEQDTCNTMIKEDLRKLGDKLEKVEGRMMGMDTKMDDYHDEIAGILTEQPPSS
ncbi:uncharacterized protein LOC134177229 isoform X2 [Corticium candelabrum]|uniref:uncharacterized protein LOC134177229 isoform X2 n=1 Tax=Corticium candelabrum TaxID=121492 RepID=UPI002E2548C5|nr:uncharacterized protein LOC134177229 isoform X2 [Corticium candelabrum]